MRRVPTGFLESSSLNPTPPAWDNRCLTVAPCLVMTVSRSKTPSSTATMKL